MKPNVFGDQKAENHQMMIAQMMMTQVTSARKRKFQARPSEKGQLLGCLTSFL